jgi:polysaccharide export outer membrane protein
MVKSDFKKIIIFVNVIIVFSACNSVKNLTYFQKSKRYADTLAVAAAYIPKIQTGDILSIYVSSLSAEASSFFNPYNGFNSNGGNNSNTGSAVGVNQTPGFLVDPSGDIQYPLIGNIKVIGLTTAEVREAVRSKLKLFLKEPTVIVRYLNFKVTFLGEVGHPEVFNISNEMVTLPEAISLAGDLTPFAQRDSVEVIRDVNGKKQIGIVNLTNREVFNSPYYYLHPNDIVYVRPSKFKAQHNDRFFTLFSFGTGVLSLLLFLFRK